MDSHAQARVDLNAITGNVAALREHVAPAAVMAVVKADGYGHGAVPAARAALRGGARWLGVAHVAEALELRAAGIDSPLLCLMAIGEQAHADAIAAGVDLSGGLRGHGAAPRRRGGPGRPPGPGAPEGRHRAEPGRRDGRRLAVCGRRRAGGAGRRPPQRRGTVVALRLGRRAGQPVGRGAARRVQGGPDSRGEGAGITPQVRHIANTAAALDVPQARYDLVRIGGGIYGLSTLPGGAPAWLRPAMTLRARLILVKRVPAGTGVSYGHRYVTSRETTLGLVPLGYADGIPRSASGLPLVFARGRRWPIAGTVCMDQFVIDFGDEPVAEGDEVVFFGPGDDGEPTAQEWGDTLGTISYEIVTGIGARVPRSYP